MPPNLRRYLPLLMIAFLLIVLLPALLGRRSSSGPSASSRATTTIDAINLIDRAERRYEAAHGRYTSHLADLLPSSKGLAADLTLPLSVQLDVGSGGRSFVARVESDVLSILRARQGGKLLAQSCTVVKSGSGVACP